MSFLLSAINPQKLHVSPPSSHQSEGLHLIQERKREEVTQDGTQDHAQKDPGVVGHDAQHQHVSQNHLQHMEGGLDHMQQPAEEEEEEHH